MSNPVLRLAYADEELDDARTVHHHDEGQNCGEVELNVGPMEPLGIAPTEIFVNKIYWALLIASPQNQLDDPPFPSIHGSEKISPFFLFVGKTLPTLNFGQL